LKGFFFRKDEDEVNQSEVFSLTTENILLKIKKFKMKTVNNRKRTVNSVSNFVTESRTQKIVGLSPAKGLDEIGVDLFSFYVNYFRYNDYSYTDAVEVEAIKLAEETELFIKAECGKIQKIIADRTSKVRVYSDLLYQVVDRQISPEDFFKAKGKLCIYS
jgi:hypothetical protein